MIKNVQDIQVRGIPMELSHLLHLAKGVKTAGEMLMTDESIKKLKEYEYVGQTRNGIYFITKKGIETLCDLGFIRE